MNSKQPEQGPFEKELREKIGLMYDQGLKNIHFDWTEEAAGLGIEERCKEALLWFNESFRWQAMTELEKIMSQLEDIYEYIETADQLIETSKEPFLQSEWKDRDYAINSATSDLDFAKLLIGNYLDRKVMHDIKDKVKIKVAAENIDRRKRLGFTETL